MRRWLFTAFSFAVVAAVSWNAVKSSAPNGIDLTIPFLGHALAFSAFLIEVISRSFKLAWSGRAVGVRLPFWTGVRTSLGGDFGASITPSRAGAEPARYLILHESGVRGGPLIAVLYAELFFEMISLVIVATLMLAIFSASRSAYVAVAGVLGIYASGIIGVAAVAGFVARRQLGDQPPAWAMRFRITGTRWDFVVRWVGRIKGAVDSFKDMHRGWGLASCAASIVHVGIRFTILPVLVLSATNVSVPLGPMVLWPFTMIYGAAILPAPGGGGAVELVFRNALGPSLPQEVFAASLVWWRFYTLYLYIILGAIVAGRLALRAIREAEDEEEKLERSAERADSLNDARETR